MEWSKENYLLSDDPTKVNVTRTHQLLSETYWGVRRPRSVVEAMLKTSLCFTLAEDSNQIGFARCVTDAITFSWIADIIIEPAYRGKGLGKWMLDCIVEHPKIAPTQKVLQTRDAHAYYEKFGFTQNAALMSTEVDGL